MLLSQGSWYAGVKAWMRRQFSPYPSSISQDAERAWLQEEIRVYATLQPFATPLTTPDGGLRSHETAEIRRGYRHMAMYEPSVKAALLTKCLAVASLDMQVQPANKRSIIDKEAAHWVDYSIANSYGGVPGLVMSVLLPSLIDGFSITEPVLDKVDPLAEDYPGFWTLKHAKGKETNEIRFRLDQYRNILGVQAMGAGQGGISFNPNDFIIFSHLSFFCDPFGISDLRAANRAANLIEAAIKLRSILLENFSGPYLVAKAKDPTAQAKCKAILGQARARGWIVLPDNAELEVINLATSAPDQFQNSIEDLRQEIVTAIQGAYLQLLEGGVSNGRGNTQTHLSVAQLFQWWLAAEVCNVINHGLVPLIVKPNYGRRCGMPRVQLGGIDPAAIQATLMRFKTLQELGADLSRDQVYEEGYAEQPKDAADTLKPPSQSQQQPGGNVSGASASGGGGNPFDSLDLGGDGKGGADSQQFADTFPAGFALGLIDPEVLGLSPRTSRKRLVPSNR